MSSNKTIAKNTIMLYIRMLISMLVGLYTSRVVLQTLGVEDYGIYGVVGGVVSMMGFLNASMSGATSRFITFELGRGDIQRVRNTFSSAMIIHIGIAFVVILLAETVGLWFLCNKLVIPDGRMEAAHWVYQCSIVSAAVGITQTPYTAVVMSREKMDIYAYMELLNVSLKLGIVYLLVIGNFDKLILYSILTLVVSFFMCCLYRLYCIKHYEESRFRCILNKEVLKPMLSFSGWDLFGNMSFSVAQQGRNFIVNSFFGVSINAACGVASTVQGIIQGFSGNILSAFRPQIIKAYANDDVKRMEELMINAAKFSILLLMIISAPLVININWVLTVWLGTVPVYAGSFCRILLFQNIVTAISLVVTEGIHATGKVKGFVLTGSVLLFQLPMIYYSFVFTNDPNWAYYVLLFVGIVNLFIYIGLLKRHVPIFHQFKFLCNICIAMFVCVFCSIPLYLIQVNNFIIQFTLHCLVYLFCVCLVSYAMLLNKQQKKSCRRLMKGKVRSIWHFVFSF